MLGDVCADKLFVDLFVQFELLEEFRRHGHFVALDPCQYLYVIAAFTIHFSDVSRKTAATCHIQSEVHLVGGNSAQIYDDL